MQSVAGIEVELIRGGVKNYNLRVRPDGTVRVSMPARGNMASVERLVESHRTWILERQRRASATATTPPDPHEVQRDREELAKSLPDLISRYERELGVSCSGWRLRRMVSRWGSCNIRTKKITINTELAHHPTPCLESVVVHELCHLIEPRHNAHFYALMDEHFPAWRETKAYLNAHPPRR